MSESKYQAPEPQVKTPWRLRRRALLIAKVLIVCAGQLAACNAHSVSLPKGIRDPHRPETNFSEPVYGVLGNGSDVAKVQSLISESPDRASTPAEMEAILRIMARAEQSRGLRFIRPVPVRVQSEEHMAKTIVAFARDQGFHLERAYNTAIALGLWDADKDVDAFIGDGRNLDVAGYYNHRSRTLVIRNDLAVALVNPVSASVRMQMTATLLHELVHALQDQHFGLGQQIEKSRTTDAQEAYLALLEGDATLTMMQYQYQRLGISFPSMLADEQLFNAAIAKLPRLHDAKSVDASLSAAPILFRYFGGARFSGAIVRRTGLEGLGAAYLRPPRSTQQVLDYNAYLANHAAPPLRRIPTRALKARGYRVLGHDTLGRVYLSGFMRLSGIGGDVLAEGWEGDRIVTFRRGGRVGAIWIIAMANDEQASAIAKRASVSLERTQKGNLSFATGTSLRTAYVVNNVHKRHVSAVKSALEAWLHGGGAFPR